MSTARSGRFECGIFSNWHLLYLDTLIGFQFIRRSRLWSRRGSSLFVQRAVVHLNANRRDLFRTFVYLFIFTRRFDCARAVTADEIYEIYKLLADLFLSRV